MRVKYAFQIKFFAMKILMTRQRFLILGAFGIRVINGEISLAGAVLRPADNVYWVHSPHCLALPVIRTTEETRIELHDDPNLSNLRKLGRLSPLFRGIWNEKSKTVDGTGTVGKSFQIVSIMKCCYSTRLTDIFSDRILS